MPGILPESVLPKVKFLTVVWGEKYIERFCSLSLPSFLAPGNLPALAEATRLEVVIMTRTADVAFFENNRSFQKLRSICPVRFVEIDDLITTAVYGVTLTLAYARPIIASGKEMLETHFVFMNADFVLADGSLRSLLRPILDGRSIVLGPSYRAVAEELEPVLEKMVDTRRGTLTIPARKLVGMALSHPHRTTIAKTFNQRAFSSSHPNQLFWQVDEHTVLGRYFLIFMLCLKPERVVESVNCYCDYSFIPEMCPSGDEVAMGDSDDFFMLELQSRTQETFMLRSGQMAVKTIARSLQEWSTVAHRRAAGYDIVFHSKNLPSRIEEIKGVAAQTVAEIQQHLGEPKPHQNHHYWVMGVEAWKEYRRKQGLSDWAPELAPYRPGIVSKYYLIRHAVAVFVKSRARKVARKLETIIGKWLTNVELFVLNEPNPNSLGSPHRQTMELQRQIYDCARGDGQNASLLIVGHPGQFGAFGSVFDRADRMLEARVARSNARSARYDRIVYFPMSLRDDEIGRTVARLLGRLKSGGSLHILAQLSGDQSHDDVIAKLVFELGEMLGNHLETFAISSAGNRSLYLSHRLRLRAARWLLGINGRFRQVAVFMIAPVSLLSMGLACLANAFASSGGKDRLVKHCLGVAMQLRISGALNRGANARRKAIKSSL